MWDFNRPNNSRINKKIYIYIYSLCWKTLDTVDLNATCSQPHHTSCGLSQLLGEHVTLWYGTENRDEGRYHDTAVRAYENDNHYEPTRQHFKPYLVAIGPVSRIDASFILLHVICIIGKCAEEQEVMWRGHWPKNETAEIKNMNLNVKHVWFFYVSGCFPISNYHQQQHRLWEMFTTAQRLNVKRGNQGPKPVYRDSDAKHKHAASPNDIQRNRREEALRN